MPILLLANIVANRAKKYILIVLKEDI